MERGPLSPFNDRDRERFRIHFKGPHSSPPTLRDYDGESFNNIRDNFYAKGDRIDLLVEFRSRVARGDRLFDNRPPSILWEQSLAGRSYK